MSTQERIDICYQQGVKDYKSGAIDSNPYGLGQLLERSAWSSGFFDAAIGYV